MKYWTNSAVALLAVTAGTVASQAALSQVSGNSVRSRGVMVLRPNATPTPSPSPAPTAAATPAPAPPAPAPTPTPIVQPAPIPIAKPTPLPLPAPVIKTCPRPYPHVDVTLTDGAGFDRKLRSKLAGRNDAVVVDLPAPYALGSAPPAALGPWLDAVKSSGGQLTVKTYCQDSRGLFGNFFKRLFAPGGDAKPYAAAASYDAALQVDGLDQRVTQIAFKRRTGK